MFLALSLFSGGTFLEMLVTTSLSLLCGLKTFSLFLIPKTFECLNILRIAKQRSILTLFLQFPFHFCPLGIFLVFCVSSVNPLKDHLLKFTQHFLDVLLWYIVCLFARTLLCWFSFHLLFLLPLKIRAMTHVFSKDFQNGSQDD